MVYAILKEKKGQAILESTMVLILTILLLGGVLHIWIWGNSQLVNRQKSYQASRVAAGQSSDGYRLVWWGYRPPTLGEDSVLIKR
jgi:hypothetical protein